MDKIKPCPFCGSKNLYVQNNAGNYIFCRDCDAYGPNGKDEEEATRLWNRAPRVGDNDCDYPDLTGGCHIFRGKDKEEPEMEKCCKNCVHISDVVDGKVYCKKAINEPYSCKYWEMSNPFADKHKICYYCKHSYTENIEGTDYYVIRCGHAIGNPEGYVCDKWESADETEDVKASKSTPLNTENSSGLKTLCEKAISKWGEAAQINKSIEELLELAIALTCYQNLNLQDEDYQEKAYKILDNIREEREDVEIMLRQLDVIFGRSDEWQRKKYEHLRQIVGGEDADEKQSDTQSRN